MAYTNNELEITRLTKMSRVVPDPPRQGTTNGAVISWVPPAATARGLYTHFRIYQGGDGNNNLARQVPAGQTRLSDGLSGDSLFISTFNETTGLESPRVRISNTTGSDGGAGGMIIQTVPLTGDISNLAAIPVPPSGSYLLLRFQQDNDGYHDVTLGANFHANLTIAVDPRPNYQTNQLFYGKSGIPWEPVGPPVSFAI